MAVHVYGRSKVIQAVLLALSTFSFGVGIFFLLGGHRGFLYRAEAMVFIAMGIALGTTVFTYRLTLGDDYIEVKEFRRKRINFRDITAITVTDTIATIHAGKSEILIPNDYFGFRRVVGQILKAEDRFHFEIFGSMLAVQVALFLARDIHPYDESNKSESITSNLDIANLSARLVAKERVYRAIEVDAGSEIFNVEYAGMGDGYECVLVNGEVVAFLRTIFWYQPQFRFRIGNLPATIKVKFWPWMHLRSISLEIDGRIVYSEPNDRIGSTPAARRAGT